MRQYETMDDLEQAGGEIVETALEGTVQLWELPDGSEWVVYADNSVVSREEDGPEGPFFPRD